MGVGPLHGGGPPEARRRGVPAGGATVGPGAHGGLHLALGDSLATGAWPGVPRPGRADPLGARVLGVPASWFDHPEAGYPALVSRRLGTSLRLVAASLGTAGLYWRSGPTPLLDRALAGDPGLVTVTVGANDVLSSMAAAGDHDVALRFAGLLWRIPVGRGMMRRRMGTADHSTALGAAGARIEAMLRHLASTGRVVVVTTYPVGDGSDELRESFTGPLNERIRRAAAASGARVADLEPLFAGHDRTAPRRDRWISWVDGMHPVARGHAAIADAVVAVARAGPSAAPGVRLRA